MSVSFFFIFTLIQWCISLACLISTCTVSCTHGSDRNRILENKIIRYFKSPDGVHNVSREKSKYKECIAAKKIFLTKEALMKANFLNTWLKYKWSVEQEQNGQKRIIFGTKVNTQSNLKIKDSDITVFNLEDRVALFENRLLGVGRILITLDWIKELCAKMIVGSLLTHFTWMTEALLRIIRYEKSGSKDYSAELQSKLLEHPSFPIRDSKLVKEFLVRELAYNPQLFKKAIKVTLIRVQIPKFCSHLVEKHIPLILKHELFVINNDSKEIIKGIFIDTLNAIWYTQAKDRPRLSLINDFLKTYLRDIQFIFDNFCPNYLSQSQFTPEKVAIKMCYLTFIRPAYWDDFTNLLIFNYIFDLGFDSGWESKVNPTLCSILSNLLQKMTNAQWKRRQSA